MMFYRNMKVMVRPPDEDMDFFDIVAGVRQGGIYLPECVVVSPELYIHYQMQFNVI